MRLNTKYPGLKMTASKLHKFYKRQGIKYKVIRQFYDRKPQRKVEFDKWYLKTQEDLRKILAAGKRVVYVDESVFTSMTVQ